MKIGDLVRYKPEYMFNSVGVIVSVGYGEHYTDTEQSPALHPDVWVQQPMAKKKDGMK